MDTMFLNPGTWDLDLDSAANIAIASSPYASAQDAASATRTFLDEVYYDTTQGVPYWQQILGKLPPLQYVKSQWTATAVSLVPDVVSAKVFIASFNNRGIIGQLQVTDDSGQTAAIGISS